MSKFLRNILIIVAVLLLIFFLFQKINILPSFKNIFRSQPVLIEETPILIKEINTLSQLMTVTFLDEMVMDTSKPGPGLPSLVPFPGGARLLPAMDKLVIIGRGKVIAGINLKGLGEKDISQTGDSIHLTLPASTILATILNPTDYETFIEKGNWNEKAVIALKVKIRTELSARATRQNILQLSDTRSKKILETFLKNLGFKKVVIDLRHDYA